MLHFNKKTKFVSTKIIISLILFIVFPPFRGQAGEEDKSVQPLEKTEIYNKIPAIKRILLSDNLGIFNEKKRLRIQVETENVKTGTLATAELVPEKKKSENLKIKKSVVVKNDKIDFFFMLPERLRTDKYRVKIKLKGKYNLESVSGIYCITKIRGRKFYVSNLEGNDKNEGLSRDCAFKTLIRISRIKFYPGDSVFLRRGDVWIGESLVLIGNGTKKYPIVISSYGEGSKPHIKPGIRSVYGIRLVNEGGYKIRDMEVSDCYGGVAIWEENTYNHKYIGIENCYFHDITDKDVPIGKADKEYSVIPDLIYGTGISIAGSDAEGKSTLLSDIHIVSCDFDRCDVGIEVIGRDHDYTLKWERHTHNLISDRAFMNVNISNCNIRHSYRTGGVMLYCTNGGKSKNLIIDETGYEGIGMWWGVAAFQVARVRNYSVEDCVFSNTIKGKSPDGEGFDFEADVHNVCVKDCKFINNEGPAVLYYGGSWAGKNDNCIVDSCYFKGNNWSTDGDYVGKVFAVGKPENKGIIKNSVIHLRDNGQDYKDTAPIIFDATNVVYDKEGNIIFGAKTHKNK